MATSPTYCTHRDIEDVYPNINNYDSKEALYGWDSLGSNKYASRNCGLITQLFANGKSLGSPESSYGATDTNDEWFYDSDADTVYYVNTSNNPNDMLIEAGEDFITLITRISKNSSRYFDARVDSRLPRDQWKDKEGNFDYIIVRTVALIAASFQIKSHDPNSEALSVLEEEYNLNIALINNGQVALSNQVTSDSSKGILREVNAPQNANPLRIVDTRGNYAGIYDNIKIIVTATGTLGVSKFNVYSRSTDKLKDNEVVQSEIISGAYQSIGHGMQIRFAGSNDASIATINDEYELEVWGLNEELDNPIIKSVRMSRTSY
tara:strand:- start:5537 stop:6496 length:960 start_codon:yes stop_codon:yes gene_type:complete